MARGELLRKLFESFIGHDDDRFKAVALEIVAEEQQKQNHSLARDLLAMLETAPIKKATEVDPLKASTPVPRDRDRLLPLVDVRRPTRPLAETILKPRVKAQLERVMHEFRRTELLRLHGLTPKRKLLFCGPPGCGKTLCAEAIATELQLPMLYTRFDAIITSYLGETAANIRKVFDYAQSGTWVILFDEFDAIGKSRTSDLEHGELKRVVNSFLQVLDSFEGKSIVVAATNHEGLLDSALWRRFDEVVEFERPTIQEVQALLNLKLRNFPHPRVDIKRASRQLVGLSHAEVEWVCIEAIKSAILQDSDEVSVQHLAQAIANQKDRIRVSKGVSTEKRKAPRNARASAPKPPKGRV